MKIKIFVGFALGIALTTIFFLAGNVVAIVQEPDPILSSVTPNYGYTTGGEAITITGQYFEGVSQVLFGSSDAQIQSTSANSLVVIAPAHMAGFVDIQIKNSSTSVTAANAYEYITPPPPAISSVTPNTGSVEGGTVVILTGANLNETESVTFDGLPAIINSASDSQISVLSPAHEAGLVDLAVISSFGIATILNAFEYIESSPPPVPLPPSISSLSPREGSIDGNTEVTIYGSNLDTVVTVFFAKEAASIISAGSSELVVRTPAHPLGVVSVTVINPDGSTIFENGFTYTQTVSPPVFTYCDWQDNGQSWKEVKEKGNNKQKKALVCHQQSKPKNTFRTLCLPLSAIPAHLNHGDNLGACAQ